MTRDGSVACGEQGSCNLQTLDGCSFKDSFEGLHCRFLHTVHRGADVVDEGAVLH